MISDARVSPLASVAAISRPCSSMAVCRKTYLCAGGYPRMVIATDVGVEAATRTRSERTVGLGSSGTSSLSWKPPWEARKETRGMLTGVGYDTDAMERFFVHRPERTWARCAQIVVEVGGTLVALAVDQITRAMPATNAAPGTVGGDSNIVNGGIDDMGTSSASAIAPGHIRRAVTRLGPNFVKIGQALASRPDLVGEAIAGELLFLQDEMPLFSNEIAREFIHEELGAYPEDIFKGMIDTPVAAASLGQVYKAWVDGRPVAVKVQRPELLEAVGLDFYIARAIAAAITRLSQGKGFFGGRLAVRSDLVAAVDEYGSRLFEELDYRVEAQNMVRFKELYGAMPGVVVPSVLLAYSGKRVITSEWIDGEKLVDAQAQVSAADLPILRVGIDCTLTQLLDKGFLHADPHGGNLLKTPDKRLAYLDFGLVSVIPPGVMDALICATVQVMNRDYVALAKGFPALALMSEGDLAQDFGLFATALEGALDPIVADFRRQMGLDGGFGDGAPSGSERVAFAQLIDRVFLLARSFNFKVPPYFISNVRALGELEGLAMTADPGFNLISVVYPYVCRRLLSDPSPSLRAALSELTVAEDGTIQWEMLEALMKDSNALDERVGAGGESRRPPLDLSLEFLLSADGAFVRAAAVADLRSAAFSAVKNLFSSLFRDRSTSRIAATAASSVSLRSNRFARLGRGRKTFHQGETMPRECSSSKSDDAVLGGGGAGEVSAAREASRRKLRRLVLRGARRRPLLVARVGAAVVVATGRAVGTAVLGAFRRLLPKYWHRTTTSTVEAASTSCAM